MLNVGRLRVLSEVARRGSFSAAAEALSYTQSAVSQQIAVAGGRAGGDAARAPPARRAPDGGGQAPRRTTEGILAQLQAAEAELAAIAGLRGGQLRMASFPTAGATLMPLAIANFRARLSGRRADARGGRAGGDRAAPERRASSTSRCCSSSRAGRRSASTFKRVHLLKDPMYLALPQRAPAGAQERGPPAGPERGVVGADLARERVRALRRALLPRRGLRAEGVIRERRLPDGAGARGGGRRRRADPGAGALGRARGHRDPRALARPRRCARCSRRCRRARAWRPRRRRCWILEEAAAGFPATNFRRRSRLTVVAARGVGLRPRRHRPDGFYMLPAAAKWRTAKRNGAPGRCRAPRLAKSASGSAPAGDNGRRRFGGVFFVGFVGQLRQLLVALCARVDVTVLACRVPRLWHLHVGVALSVYLADRLLLLSFSFFSSWFSVSSAPRRRRGTGLRGWVWW